MCSKQTAPLPVEWIQSFLKFIYLFISLFIYLSLFTPGWSPAYLFEVVFLNVYAFREHRFSSSFMGFLVGLYVTIHPHIFLLFKVTLLQQRTVLLVT